MFKKEYTGSKTWHNRKYQKVEKIRNDFINIVILKLVCFFALIKLTPFMVDKMKMDILSVYSTERSSSLIYHVMISKIVLLVSELIDSLKTIMKQA